MIEKQTAYSLMLLTFLLGMWLGVGCGIHVGKDVKDKDWQKIMIEKGYAEMVPDESHKVFKWKN